MNNVFRAVPFEIKLNEVSSNADIVPSNVQVLRTGTFFHEVYGKLEITTALLSQMKANFDAKVRRLDLAVDYKHENEDIAAGWIRDIILMEQGTELWAVVSWTPQGKRKLAEKEFRYLSAEFDLNYKDNESLQSFGATLFGAGLTNRPFVKDMVAVVELAESKPKDELHKELEARSKKYGIEMTPDAALTPPAGQPTDADSYGDPVNYKFPLADQAQAANARVRFKQFANQTYQQVSSRNVVHERIVRKELAYGSQPSFDSKDPLDQALPQDLKDKLQKPKQGGGNKMSDTTVGAAVAAPGAPGAPEMSPEEMKAKIKELEAKIAELMAAKNMADEAAKYAEQKSKFDKFLTEGKVCEAQREAFMKGDAVKLAELSQPVKLATVGDGITPAPVVASGTTEKDPSEKVLELAEKKIADKEVKDLGQAISMVLSENEELRKQYENA